MYIVFVKFSIIKTEILLNILHYIIPDINANYNNYMIKDHWIVMAIFILYLISLRGKVMCEDIRKTFRL